MHWKVDLHVHTHYSPDAITTPEALVEHCRRKGIHKIAVTDHNTIAGALALKEIAPDLVIVGEEILTNEGELLAFFLERHIPPGFSPWKTIEMVKAQGGLIGVSHPFDRLRREAMRKFVLEIADELDFIEVFNARTVFPGDDTRALKLARAKGIPATAGSDAHLPFEVGRAYVEMPPFNDAQEFLRSLAQGHIRGRRSPLWVHILSTWNKIRR